MSVERANPKETFVTGYAQAYANYLCARDGHQVTVNATSTTPQPFSGGTCTRCGHYVKPEASR